MTTTLTNARAPALTRCLFCHRPFPENGRLVRMPRGRRIAFDPDRGRLWTVCDRCGRWTLAPIEDRGSALYELERLARDEGRPLGQTANVTLLQAGTLTLVRVGRAGLVEQSWWRYGRELRRRKAAIESRRSRVSAYTFGAMRWVGDAVGFSDEDVSIDCGEQVIHWNSKAAVRAERKQIAAAFALFRGAYEAKGRLPAGRDPSPSPAERS